MDTPVRTITSETFINSAAVSNNIAVVGSEMNNANEGVHTFDLTTGQLLQTLRGQGNNSPVAVALSPNGQLAVASTPAEGVATDTNGRVAFSPDGQLILAAFFADLVIFDTALGQKSKFRIHNDGGTLFAIASSPEGRFMAAGYVRFDSGNDLVIYDLVSGQPKLTLVTNKGDGVTCVAWTGNNIITGSGDGSIKLWDAQSGAMVSRPFPKHPKPVKALAVSSDGRLALSGSDDSTMKVIEVSTGKELHSFNHGDRQVEAVAFASNSKIAVSGGGKTLKLWDLTGL
jgi:WD40 repeat protein